MEPIMAALLSSMQKNEKQHQLRYENGTASPIGLSNRIRMRGLPRTGSAKG
jgi:hypothetical protein